MEKHASRMAEVKPEEINLDRELQEWRETEPSILQMRKDLGSRQHLIRVSGKRLNTPEDFINDEGLTKTNDNPQNHHWDA